MADRPVVLITGAAGNLGRSIAETLADAYEAVGPDVKSAEARLPVVETGLTPGQEIETTLAEGRERCGGRLASVVHLAAYFDFSGEPHPLYEKLNIAGTGCCCARSSRSRSNSSSMPARCWSTLPVGRASGSTRTGRSARVGPIRGPRRRRRAPAESVRAVMVTSLRQT